MASDAAANFKMDAFRKNFMRFQEQSSSLFLLSLQWKDLEDHYAALHHAIERKREGVREIFFDVEAKQEEFRLIEALIEDRCKELDSVVEEFVKKHRLVIEETANAAAGEIERRLTEIEGEGKKYESQCADLLRLIDEQFGEVLSREKQVKAASAELNQRLKELDLKERVYEERLREFELENCRFDVEQYVKLREVNAMESLIKQKFDDFDSKNRELEERCRELESRESKFHLDQSALIERSKDLNSKELNLGKRLLAFETTRIIFEAERAVLDKAQSDFGFKSEKFDLEMKEFKSRVREFEEREKCAQANIIKFESERKLKLEELDSREKQVEVREIFEQRSMECQIKADRCLRNYNTIEKGKLAGLVDIEGLNLQIFLNESKDEERINKVSILLRMCRDPAKVVLDAMEGFFPPHLMEFKGSVVRQSCIILLEQLMKISPDISEDVKSDATKLSSNWMSKLRPVNEFDCHILGFLFLIATYRCHEAFVSELIPFVKIVAHWRQAPELCRILGLRDKIPVIIKDLLGKKQRLSAIRFACVFDKRSEFPLERILNEYMEISKTQFKAIYHGASSTLEDKTKATNKRIADLEAAKRCIVDFDLQLGYRSVEFDNAICELKKQLAGQISAAAAIVSLSKGMEPDCRELCSPEVPPAPLNLTTTANSSLTQRAVNTKPSEMMLPEQNNIKHLRTVSSQRAENHVIADSGVRVNKPEAGPKQQIGSTIPQGMANSVDATAANLLGGSKRKQSEGCYEDTRKTKLIVRSDPSFVPPPPSCRKSNPKRKRFRSMNRVPFVNGTGSVQFADMDNPYSMQNLSAA